MPIDVADQDAAVLVSYPFGVVSECHANRACARPPLIAKRIPARLGSARTSGPMRLKVKKCDFIGDSELCHCATFCATLGYGTSRPMDTEPNV